MASPQVRSALGQLHRLLGPEAAPTISDSQLLEDFVSRRDDKSFEVLVWRHAAMVLGVCERVLRNSHDAEDAFQATILIFARRASIIGQRDSVAGWLYKVAHRVALRAHAKASRHLADALPDVAGPQSDFAEWRDLRPVLDEEINRLPQKYRVPFVLCYLEGQTNEQAAEQIGCPKGTVLSRLSRGRDWLRSRLVRRGIALSSPALLTVLSSQAASAAAPAALMASTLAAAIPFAAGAAAGRLVAPAVVSLTEGVLHAMFVSKLKVAAALVALAVLGTSAGIIGPRAFADNREIVAARPVADPPTPREPAEDLNFFTDNADDGQERERNPNSTGPDAAGKVTAVANDGTSFQIEAPPKERGGESSKINVKIGPKTTLVYNGVPSNGAKPTEGYTATVRMEDAGKGLASSIRFAGSEGHGRVAHNTLAGTVSAISKDGKGFTLEASPRDRLNDAKTAEILFDPKTVIVISNVRKGEAKIVEGMAATVHLVDGTKNNTAGLASFLARDGEGRGSFRRDRAPSLAGKLVASDDNSLTIESGGRGEEPTKTTVKLTDKSEVRFFNVILGAAKPAEGMTVQIQLEDGSKDQVALAMLWATIPDRWTTVQGKVVAVGNDGSSITLEQSAAARGDEPKRTTVKLTAETKSAYMNVGPNEAKPTVGYFVQARLLDGSPDTAAQAIFSKAGPDGNRGR